jgi:hypothetical protein
VTGVAVDADPPARIGRRDLLARLVAGPLLGVVGPLVLWPAAVLQVALPATAALHLARRAPEGYLAEDGPRVVDGLEWLLGLCAWTALAADAPPGRAGNRTVRLRVAVSGVPGPGRAIARALTGLPAAAGLMALEALLLAPWLVAVACVLIAGRQPGPLRRLQAGLLTLRARHLARQASLTARSAGTAEEGLNDPVDREIGRSS